VKIDKLFSKIVAGRTTNVPFSDLVTLVSALGFEEVGGRGSHRVFVCPQIPELLNLQQVAGQAKPYQVRQVAAVIRRYDLKLEG
jgi:hypothetical protein